MNRECNVTKRVQTKDGLRYCRVVLAANGRVVIGVVSQYVPFSETWLNATLSYTNMQLHNSGYSIAEPMDSVLELIGK